MSEVPLYGQAQDVRGSETLPSSASDCLTDYSQVDMLGLLYKFVNFGVEKSQGTTRTRAIHAY